MDKRTIKELIRTYLGKKQMRELHSWVMTSCPFAEYTHPDGDDKRFSFGISVHNGFNCFTCGMKGHIIKLPRMLARYTHKVPYGFEDFIREAIAFDNQTSYAFEDNVELSEIDKSVLDGFEPAPEVLSLTKKDIEKWDIRRYGDSLLFPVYTKEGKLVAVKVRSIHRKFFYYLFNTNIKRAGVWYGSQFSPNGYLALVEGERDAILLSRYIPAWASLGAPTKAQINKIKEVRTKRLILFFDNDEAGQKMLEEVRYELAGLFKLYIVKDYLGCKDPAELVEKGLIKHITLKKL